MSGAGYLRPAYRLRITAGLSTPGQRGEVALVTEDAAGREFILVWERGADPGWIKWVEPGDVLVVSSDLAVPLRGEAVLFMRGPLAELCPDRLHEPLLAMLRDRRERARPENRWQEETQQAQHGRLRPSPEPTMAEVVQTLTALRAELADLRAGRGGGR